MEKGLNQATPVNLKIELEFKSILKLEGKLKEKLYQ